jgi:hypothetical protein
VKGLDFEDIQRAVKQTLNGIPQNCVPGMLQTMAAPLENVCAGTRAVL